LTPEDSSRAIIQLCSDGYFQTLGMRVLQGRDLTSQDLAEARRVAVVNRTFVERYLSGRDPLGRRVTIKTPALQTAGEDHGFEIVGVFADAKNHGIQDPPSPEAIIPSSSARIGARALVVKTAGPPLALLERLKREIWAVDRDVSVGSSRTLAE